jgi:hypothetical protein
MHFTGTTILKLKDGMIVEEVGLHDGVTASSTRSPRHPRSASARSETMGIRLVNPSSKAGLAVA